MIKATTINGTYYIIDYNKQRAKRVKGPNRHSLHGDNDWFHFASVVAYPPTKEEPQHEPPTIGKAMYFTISGVDSGPYDWRLSTKVVSIEEVEESVEH